MPSLTSNTQFGPEKSTFAIRGFTQEGKTAPSVGVYLADVIAPRSNGGTTSGNGAGVGSFMDLQDVQVLKGPQGTLFGRNTTGGAILLVPAKPTQKLEGWLQGSVGDYNMHRVEGMLNVPLSDTFRVRGAFDWNQRDGYLKNISGIGPSSLGNTDYFAGRISIVGDLTPNLENYTIASYSNSHNRGVVPKLFTCDTPAQAALTGGLASLFQPNACAQLAKQNAAGGYWDVQNSDPNPFEKVQQWQVINTTTWQASDTLKIKNIASYAEYREQAAFSLEGEDFPYTGPQSAGGFTLNEFNPANVSAPTTAIQLYPGYSGNNSAESTFTEELQFQGRSSDDRLNWQIGGYIEVSDPLGFSSGLTDIFQNCTNIQTLTCDDRIFAGPFPAGSVSNSQVKDTFNDKAVYAQATYKLTQQLSLTGGIRYTSDHLKDESQDTNIYAPGVQSCQDGIAFNAGTNAGGGPIPLFVANSAQCDLIIKEKSSRPTWLIDLDYKPTRDLLAYVKWARGYREGAINPNDVGLETVGPEKVDTYEGGLKATLRGAFPGYFDIAGFYNNFRNQELDIDPIVAPAYQGSIPQSAPIINAGKSRIWGIEVDTSVRLFPGFNVDAGYTYLNTKLQSDTGVQAILNEIQSGKLPYYTTVFPTAAVGDPLPESPKNRVTLTGTYTLPLDESIGRVSFGATFTHTDADQIVAASASPLYKAPAENLLNLNADWKSVFGKPFDLSFFMTNATNAKFYTFPGTANTIIGGENAQINMPRMWGFRLKAYFGS